MDKPKRRDTERRGHPKMSSSWSFILSTPPLPSLLPPKRTSPSLHINSKPTKLSIHKDKLHQPHSLSAEPQSSDLQKLCSLLQYGAVLASVNAPAALAVTGNNHEMDLTTTLIQSAIVAVLYFIVAPPIIFNWLRMRWFKRKLLEMYFQFMFVFIFFPGMMLWAPFLNFRKFPRDPTMKNPWDTPKGDVPLYRSR